MYFLGADYPVEPTRQSDPIDGTGVFIVVFGSGGRSRRKVFGEKVN